MSSRAVLRHILYVTCSVTSRVVTSHTLRHVQCYVTCCYVTYFTSRTVLRHVLLRHILYVTYSVTSRVVASHTLRHVQCYVTCHVVISRTCCFVVIIICFRTVEIQDANLP